MQVDVRYFAGARAAAGVPSEQVELPDGASVEHLLKLLGDLHGDDLRKVLAASSFLLDEVAVRDHLTVLHPGAAVDVLPPFAGG